MEETAKLIETAEGLALSDGKNEIRGDFSRLLPRVRRGNLASEHLVRAVKLKGLRYTTSGDAKGDIHERFQHNLISCL